ncbi:sugar-non-specific nuclease inhibitor [Minicystis rosea]|nr:sugar-non-specific nuclease inhibitor [Minicystis rosea]
MNQKSDEAILHRINAAGGGLSYPSERDAPLLPCRFAGSDTPTSASVLAAAGKPEGTPVELRTLEDFFEGLTDAGEEASFAERTEAEQWQALMMTLQRELDDVRVYWIGRVDVDAYVLGRTPSGTWLGLRTHAVET